YWACSSSFSSSSSQRSRASCGGRLRPLARERNLVWLKVGGYLLPPPQEALERWEDDEEKEEEQAQ
ncbi:hypothetical protein, partial [Meiothermus luteus]|uniref:hypothetical protein n=1 Tax=Meiothermus luteus TaxID=2026184 RepID=UPI001C717023